MTQPNPPGGDMPEWKLYLWQLQGLWAGRKVPVSRSGRRPGSDISACTNDELQMLIGEAQRQLDALTVQLEQVRQRAQFLFSTLIVLIGVAFAAAPLILKESKTHAFLIWGIALLVLILALAEAAGIIVNSKVMGTVDAAWLTRQSRPWLAALAQEYLDSIDPSASTTWTQVTLLRDTALLTILGTIGVGTAWCLALI